MCLQAAFRPHGLAYRPTCSPRRASCVCFLCVSNTSGPAQKRVLRSVCFLCVSNTSGPAQKRVLRTIASSSKHHVLTWVCLPTMCHTHSAMAEPLMTTSQVFRWRRSCVTGDGLRSSRRGTTSSRAEPSCSPLRSRRKWLRWLASCRRTCSLRFRYRRSTEWVWVGVPSGRL